MSETKNLVIESKKTLPLGFFDPGSPVEPVFDFVYDDDHVLQVAQVGTRDVDAEIQTFADQCGMEYVLRSVAAGDTSVLNARQGVYGDFSGAPTTLAEVQVQQAQAGDAFAALPDNIKNGRSAEDVISLTKEQLDQYIKQAIDSKLKEQEAPTNEQ